MEKKSTHTVPVFSVIIPVYNRGHLIKETLDSVLNQHFKDFETIVINDGSTDNTAAVLQMYSSQIKVIHQKNQGPEHSRNRGVDQAQGRYLAFLDSDDILEPFALSVYYDIIQAEKSPAILFARGYGMANREKPVLCQEQNINHSSYYIFKNYLAKTKGVWLSTSFLVIRRSLWHRKTAFQSGTFPVDDLDLMLRIGEYSPCILIHYPRTVGYRLHQSNSINDIKQNFEKLELILKLEHHGEYPGGVKRKFARLAIIGGHIVSWGVKGLKQRIYIATLSLLLKGILAIFAILIKKLMIRLFFISPRCHTLTSTSNKSLSSRE